MIITPTTAGVPFGSSRRSLQFLARVLFLNALRARGSTLLIKLRSHGAMEILLEDYFGLDVLKLGLEVFGGMCARIASTTGVS